MISKQLITGRDEFGACSECWTDQNEAHLEYCYWSGTKNKISKITYISLDEAIRDIKTQTKMLHFMLAYC
jgi:hypothetical protein